MRSLTVDVVGISREARTWRRETLKDWGDELPGLHLNYFADELPAVYHRDQSARSVEDVPVLRRCEIRARTRRGCFASAVSAARDVIAAEILFFDQAVQEGQEADYEWGWASHDLPRAFCERYDRDFHRRMLAHTLSLWERMASGTFTVPWCTAEELLLSTLLDDYAVRLGALELEPGWVDLEEVWFVDHDFMLLFDGMIAEREEVLAALSNQGDMALEFDAWFLPFRFAESTSSLDPTPELVLREINGGGYRTD